MNTDQTEMFVLAERHGTGEFEKYLLSFVKAGRRPQAEQIFRDELLKILRAAGGFFRSDLIVGRDMVATGERLFGEKEADAIVMECVNQSIDEVTGLGHPKAV